MHKLYLTRPDPHLLSLDQSAAQKGSHVDRAISFVKSLLSSLSHSVVEYAFLSSPQATTSSSHTLSLWRGGGSSLGLTRRFLPPRCAAGWPRLGPSVEAPSSTAHGSFFPSATAPSSVAELLTQCLEALEMSRLDADKRCLDGVVALPMEEFLVVAEAMSARFDYEEDRQRHEGGEED
jgi:hypothetical protein